MMSDRGRHVSMKRSRVKVNQQTFELFLTTPTECQLNSRQLQLLLDE